MANIYQALSAYTAPTAAKQQVKEKQYQATQGQGKRRGEMIQLAKDDARAALARAKAAQEAALRKARKKRGGWKRKLRKKVLGLIPGGSYVEALAAAKDEYDIAKQQSKDLRAGLKGMGGLSGSLEGTFLEDYKTDFAKQQQEMISSIDPKKAAKEAGKEALKAGLGGAALGSIMSFAGGKITDKIKDKLKMNKAADKLLAGLDDTDMASNFEKMKTDITKMKEIGGEKFKGKGKFSGLDEDAQKELFGSMGGDEAMFGQFKEYMGLKEGTDTALQGLKDKELSEVATDQVTDKVEEPLVDETIADPNVDPRVAEYNAKFEQPTPTDAGGNVIDTSQPNVPTQTTQPATNLTATPDVSDDVLAKMQQDKQSSGFLDKLSGREYLQDFKTGATQTMKEGIAEHGFAGTLGRRLAQQLQAPFTMKGLGTMLRGDSSPLDFYKSEMTEDRMAGAPQELQGFLNLPRPYGSDFVGDPTAQMREEQENIFGDKSAMPSKWNFGRFY